MPLWWSVPILLVLAAALFLLRRRNARLEEQRSEIESLYARRTREVKESEELLRRQSEERHRFLFETAASAIVVLDPEHRIREWNPEAERLFGDRRDEALGKDFIAGLLPAAARPAAGEHLRRLTADQPRSSFESPVVGRDGKRRAVSWNLSRVQDAAGQAVSIVAVGADVTERKRAMEALRLNHARWQALGEALAVGVVLLGHGHRVLLANPAARRMLEALNGTSRLDVLERLGPIDLEEVLCRHREPRPVEIQLGEGRPRIFEAKPNPVVGGGGGEWVLALAEVTAERETERKLWLRQRLAAVGQLAAGIAHDFNNLLQSITLAAEISREDPEADPEEHRENLDLILHQAQRAAELVRQILDFSRQSPTRSQSLVLGPFVDEAMALLRRTLPEPVRWELEAGHRELAVSSDPAQLQQLLTNLAVNAGAAMPDGGTITIALGERRFERGEDKPFEMMGPGPWVTLEFSDTGCGMPPEVRERIFEPFFSTRKRTEGAGLGLAQVYGIVKQQGGFIDVESEVGRGTTFTVYLPPGSPPEDDAEAEFADVEVPDGGGRLVLLVEDDPAILRGARMALISFGYKVLSAADGESGLELYERHGDDITLVLSDVVMPGIGGIEMVRRLAERGARAAVLFMTGYAPRDGETGHPTPEGTECLQKPFSLEEMAEGISRALRRRREKLDG